MGITKRTYDEYHGTDVDEEGIRPLTSADMEPIYKENYWLKCECHELPPRVDWAVFDWSVNQGHLGLQRLSNRLWERLRTE